MPLPKPVQRKHVHSRQIDSQGYLRDDGLWDIETRLIDTKTEMHEVLERGELEPGVAIHDISLRITVDSKMIIKDVESSTDLSPMINCSEPNNWYKKLIGEKIETGWRQKVKSIFGKEKGCTHINELLSVAATTAFQTIHSWQLQNMIKEQGKEAVFKTLSQKMFKSCHGYGETSFVIKKYRPDLLLHIKE